MSSRKPPSDWDDFDIPTWDDTVPSGSGQGTSSQSSGGRSQSRYRDPLYDDFDSQAYPANRPQSSRSSAQPPTRLSSRVPTRSTRPSRDPYRDPYSGFEDSYVEDPYYQEPSYPSQDPRRPASPSQYDLYADSAAEVAWPEADAYTDAPPSRRQRTVRHRTRSSRSSVSIARPALSDGTLAAIFGAALLGLLIMAGVVWWGIGDLADVIPWHLNASGDVDQWVSNDTLWRIPFGVFMTLVIGAVLGAFLWKRDRFAARFIVGSLCIIQVLAWVAVIDQLW